MEQANGRATAAIERALPSLRWEQQAWRLGKLVVAGVDEVGRGAWAGPLVAAAVALPNEPRSRGRLTRALNRTEVVVRDSKLMTAEHRQQVFAVLEQLEIPRAISVVEVDELDRLGLAAANRAALCQAANRLTPEPQHVLVDAYALDSLSCSHDAIIHGDCRCQSIALASIVAKVHRDALMAALDEEVPGYGFAAHKGYGTAAHQAAIERRGVTQHHRRSFAPIAKLLSDVADDG